MATLYFSGNELELQNWLQGRKDILWRPLIDIDNGVLSKVFVRAFFEELSNEAPRYRAIAEKVYRECSEYVHGNAHTHQVLPDTLSFSEDAFTTWHEQAKNIRTIVLFCLSARYLKFVNVSSTPKIQEITMEELGHIDVLRAFFGGAVEQK